MGKITRDDVMWWRGAGSHSSLRLEMGPHAEGVLDRHAGRHGPLCATIGRCAGPVLTLDGTRFARPRSVRRENPNPLAKSAQQDPSGGGKGGG